MVQFKDFSWRKEVYSSPEEDTRMIKEFSQHVFENREPLFSQLNPFRRRTEASCLRVENSFARQYNKKINNEKTSKSNKRSRSSI